MSIERKVEEWAAELKSILTHRGCEPDQNGLHEHELKGEEIPYYHLLLCCGEGTKEEMPAGVGAKISNSVSVLHKMGVTKEMFLTYPPHISYSQGKVFLDCWIRKEPFLQMLEEDDTHA